MPGKLSGSAKQSSGPGPYNAETANDECRYPCHHHRRVGLPPPTRRAGSCRASLPSIESLLSALGQDTDQIDDDFSVANRGLDQAGKAHIGPDGTNLSGPAEPLQMLDEVGMAHRDAHAAVTLGKSPHHVSAEETRPAEDRDKGTDIRRSLF